LSASLTEFELIARYFARAGLAANPAQDPAVVLGIGDDCALLNIPAGQQLALSLDVLVEGVHFPMAADPYLLAQRALAVNLSDLAAMGATPVGFSLGLTMPRAEPQWLDAFSAGLRDSATHYHCRLLGGDTTRGPLQLAIQVHGTVPAGQALRRSGAKVGDDVYVSNTLGAAALALQVLDGSLVTLSSEQRADLLRAYYQPEPQLCLGSALCCIASAAQDVSDGLLADLAHIAKASAVGMVLQANAVPVAPVVSDLVSQEQALLLALTGGDDYQLIFTANHAQRDNITQLAQQLTVRVTRIGRVVSGASVKVLDSQGVAMGFTQQGYQHF
jgi:thiamine-monophosphate kinase